MAKDRVSAGFGLASVLAVVSLGAVITLWRIEWPVPRSPELIVHGLSILTLLWAALALLFSLGKAANSLESTTGTPAPPTDPGPYLSTPTAVLLGATLTLGLPAFILMLFQAVFETVSRTISFSFGSTWRAAIWPTGWLDLAALAGAIAAARVLTRDRRTITVLFWLLTFAGLWWALQTPAFESMQVGNGVVREMATNWSTRMMGWCAGLVGVFTLAGGIIEHRRRVTAWPSQLWKLTSPLPAWPGFRYSAGTLAVTVLMLGCINLVRPIAPVSAMIAGVSMLTLAHRKWEENLADVGLALITLAVVSLAAIWRPPAASQSEFFAEVFNRTLVGLAIMTAFWHWLAGVWVQQLDHGQAWTTTGQLIHTTRRVAYLVAATGVLVAAHVALWPLLPYSGVEDAVWRWSWGMTGSMLLVMALAYATLQMAKPTLGWLTIMALTSDIVYVMARTQSSVVMQQWAGHWPLAVAGIAAVLLLLAAWAHRSQVWAPFWEPLYLSGLLILPMSAITGVSLIEQIHLPRWVPAATFACLAGVYTLAAWLPGPRGFLAVAGICAVVSIYMMV